MYFSDKISNRIFYTAERSIRGGIFDLLAGGIYFVIAVVYKLAYRNKRIAFFSSSVRIRSSASGVFFISL